MQKWYVYILKMRNWRYYIWSSIDVDRRFDEHCRWLCKSTRNNRPLLLLYKKEFENYNLALKTELYLKKQKSKKTVDNFIAAWVD